MKVRPFNDPFNPSASSEDAQKLQGNDGPAPVAASREVKCNVGRGSHRIDARQGKWAASRSFHLPLWWPALELPTIFAMSGDDLRT